MSLKSDRPEFTPPAAAKGRLRAWGLAIVAHIVLIAALTWGVGWKRESVNAPIQAELWSATAQEAAPALFEPPPVKQAEPKPEPKPASKPLPQPVVKPVAPPKAADPEPSIDPQIAIEKEKKKKLEKLKKEKELAIAKAKAEEAAEAEEERQAAAKQKREDAKKLEAKKAADDKKTKDANEAKEKAALAAAAASREAQMRRVKGILDATGGETSTGGAKQSAGPSAGYGGRVVARVKPNIVLTDDIAGNPVASVEVRAASDGTIISRKLIKSSGNSAWDNAVLRAIDKTEILPRDVDGHVPSPLVMNFRPKD